MPRVPSMQSVISETVFLIKCIDFRLVRHKKPKWKIIKSYTEPNWGRLLRAVLWFWMKHDDLYGAKVLSAHLHGHSRHIDPHTCCQVSLATFSRVTLFHQTYYIIRFESMGCVWLIRCIDLRSFWYIIPCVLVQVMATPP